MDIKCHEFFGCNKKECPIFNEEEERNCWDIEPALTPCTEDVYGKAIKMEDKIVFCRNCLFYEHVNKSEQ